MLARILILSVSLLLAGCFTVPVQYGSDDADAVAKQFDTKPGVGKVYAFRDELFGKAYGLTLYIDDKLIGDFAAQTYTVFELPAGNYEFMSRTPEAISNINVEVHPNTNSYVWLEMKMGWMYPRVKLQEVDAERGQEGVRGSKLIVFGANKKKGKSYGTAWLASSRLAITNHHVVEDRKDIKLVTDRGESLNATVLSSDALNDVAVLQLEVPYTKASPIVITSRAAKVGEKVLTIGFPHPDVMGDQAKLNTGDISALSGLKNDPRQYQISIPVQPGNSGGPLLNLKGEALGVVSSKLNQLYMAKKTGAIPENVSYAIKSAYLLPLLSGQEVSSREGNQKSVESVYNTTRSAVFQVIAK